MDVTEPAVPIEVGTYFMPTSLQDVSVVGDTIYVTAKNGGLYILRFPSEMHEVYLPVIMR